MLIVIVGYFEFVDNSLKVGFRQPYPGMIMFFMWGVLLIQISTLSKQPETIETIPNAELNPEPKQDDL